MNREISDEALVQATRKVRESMLVSLPAPESCHHEFSTEFTNNIAPLLQRAQQQRNMRRYKQRIAAAFVAMLLSLSAWLAVDTVARTVFVQWIRTVYEDSFVYEFFGIQDDAGLPDCYPSWLPEGYIETDRAEGYSTGMITYKSGEKVLFFRYYLIQQGGADQIFSEGVEPVPVQINGNSGEFFLSGVPTSSNELIWMDESRGLGFGLSSLEEQETMLKIAASVVIK